MDSGGGWRHERQPQRRHGLPEAPHSILSTTQQCRCTCLTRARCPWQDWPAAAVAQVKCHLGWYYLGQLGWSSISNPVFITITNIHTHTNFMPTDRSNNTVLKNDLLCLQFGRCSDRLHSPYRLCRLRNHDQEWVEIRNHDAWCHITGAKHSMYMNHSLLVHNFHRCNTNSKWKCLTIVISQKN